MFYAHISISFLISLSVKLIFLFFGLALSMGLLPILLASLFKEVRVSNKEYCLTAAFALHALTVNGQTS